MKNAMIQRRNEPNIREGFDHRVWELHRQGMSSHQIADQLDSTVDQVEESIKRMANVWGRD